MTQEQWTRFWKIVASIALALAALATTLAGISISVNNQQTATIQSLIGTAAASDVVARGGSNTPIYFSQGGKSLVVGTGGAIDVQSGGVLTVSGTLAGGNLTNTLTDLLNADGGIAVDTSNFTVDGTTGAVSTASSLSAASAAIGGGYGSTGCSISAAGVLQCNGAATFDGATTSTGLLSANGGIAADTNKFTVANDTGNTVIAGTLNTAGAATFQGGIVINGQTFTETAPITIDGVLTNVILLYSQQ